MGENLSKHYINVMYMFFYSNKTTTTQTSVGEYIAFNKLYSLGTPRAEHSQFFKGVIRVSLRQWITLGQQ